MNLADYSLDTKSIAHKLGFHVQYVRFLAIRGKLPALKRGRHWRFNEAEVLAYLKKQTTFALRGKDHDRNHDPEGSALLQ